MTCKVPSGVEPSGLEERDIIIACYSCPGVGPAEVHCDTLVNEFWKGREDQKPIVLSVDAAGNFPGYISSNTRSVCVGGKMVRSFLNPFIYSQLSKKFKTVKPRRIALIGFSEGCLGVREILHNKYDRSIVDFVYACDGAVGALSGAPTTDDAEKIVVQPAGEWTPDMGLSPWIEFGKLAAQTDPATGVPSKCMVVTHTNINFHVGGMGASSTRSGAQRIISEVADAGNISGPCIIPKPLIGVDKSDIVMPEGGWPSQWNDCDGKSGSGSCPDNIVAQWPVEYYKILGNLIVVGFATPTAKFGLSRELSSQPAHIFQSWWVHRQVWKDVLVPRWEVTCEHWVAPPDDPATSSAMKLMAGVATAPVPSQTRPKTLIKRSPKNIRRLAPLSGFGLGDVGTEQLVSCGVDGTISNIFDADQLAALRNRALLIPALLVGLALVGVAYYYTRD